ncbi:armadillo repeat-containing protein 5 [Biomphalaria glabrata]|nr:armadillo repeat-containing protein 5 [Biomphalaria glabrata]
MSQSNFSKQDIEKQVQHVISELQSGHGSGLYGTLITLRTTLIKSKTALRQLVKLGVVPLLVDALEDTSRHVGHDKMQDIVMSILGNLCMEEVVRKKVINNDLISAIARVTLSSEQESIHNRGIRALANLAQEANHCDKITDLEVPEFVAKCLMTTEDEECRTTYIRALRLMAQREKGVKKLVEDTQAVQALAALLKLDNKKMIQRSVRVLSEISSVRCCINFSGQILAANILEELVKLADDEDNDIGFFSFSVILKLCEQEQIRPALGSAGVISLFLKHLSSERVFVNKVSTLNALCLCTKESVNRAKIRDAGGLELLVSALQGGEGGDYAMLYDRIISSLVNFLYSDDCLARLLKHGLVSVLIEHLRRCCHLASREELLRKEVYVLADAAEIQKKKSDEAAPGQSDRADIEVLENSLTLGDSIKPQNISSFSDLQMNSPQGEGQPQCLLQAEDCSSEDPLLIDSSLATDSEGILVGEVAPDEQRAANEDLPTSLASETRHTFSINSPTYQMENSWRMEDYISGVTCKTFGPDQDLNRMMPFNSVPVVDPYSPLSAGTSYYSPAYSSPSLSNSVSPQSSPSHSSPNCGSQPDGTSPAWSLSSEHQSYRSLSQNASLSPSPAWPANFSPLLFPASPLQSEEEQGRLSPAFSSQTSLGSHIGSQDWSVLSGSQQTDHLGSQDTVCQSSQLVGAVTRLGAVPDGLVYSASEDEDEDDIALSTFDEEPVLSTTQLVECTDSSSSLSIPPSISVHHLDSQNNLPSIRKKSVEITKSETDLLLAVSLNDKNSTGDKKKTKSLKEYPSTFSENKISSCGFMDSLKSVSDGNVLNSPSKNSIDIEETKGGSKEGRELCSKNEASKNVRTAQKKEGFKVPRSSNTSDFMALSPASSDSNLHDTNVQSPYRSPFPGLCYSPKKKSIFESVKTVKSKYAKTFKISNSKTATDEGSQPEKKDNANLDRRMKKILKTSEQNILVLLSRISVKKNPAEFFAEAGVLTCLLDYVRLADMPMKRCCRILHRLCSNPLSFQKLLLLQVPALLVKLLVLEEDGTFPSVMFCAEWTNRFGLVQRSRMNLSDFHLTSSQSSEDAGSQKSEMGRLMDLEFGGDAYSKMMSTSKSSRHGFFNWDQPSEDSRSARNDYTGEAIYEPGCSRSEVRVQLGLKLLQSFCSVAMSNFGRGEISHILSSPLPQQRLACLISLLYLSIGSKHNPTRKSFLQQYQLWEQLIPYLFLPVAASAREAIISGISLNLHLENPPKLVMKMAKLDTCPDLCNKSGTPDLLTDCPSEQDVAANQSGKRPRMGISNSSVISEAHKSNLCPYSDMSALYDLHFVNCDNQEVTYGVNKEKLSSKSTVFAAMLGGSYAESSKSEIAIAEASSFGFQFVLHYLHGCSSGCSVIDSLSPVVHTSSSTDSNTFLNSPIESSDPKIKSPNKVSQPCELEMKVESALQNQEAPVDITDSQDSLCCLSLEDKSCGSVSPSPHLSLMELIDKCADILEVADKYLLTDLIQYVSSVLSHTCLQPDTCTIIFPLACFYKLESLSIDCMRETLLSNISCKTVADIYVDLATCGFKEPVRLALMTLFNNAFQK